MDAFLKTPQVHFIGKLSSASLFSSSSVFLKFSFKSGDSWTLIEGLASGETFQSEAPFGSEIPLEHPFDLNYACKAVRGWPKLLMEVWEVDSSGRNSIAGYSQMTLPCSPGAYVIQSPCFRPQGSLLDRLIGAYPELVHKDSLISSDSRFGFRCESTGIVKVEVNVLLKDFHYHGVMMQEKEGGDLYLENFKEKNSRETS